MSNKTKQYSFPKEKRICGNNQFVSILKNGNCVRNRLLTIYIAPNECGFSRLGISVGKSYGNAPKRNRIKRLIREVFRLNQNQIPSRYDYLVLIKSRRSAAAEKIKQLSFEQIQESFQKLIELSKNKSKKD